MASSQIRINLAFLSTGAI